MKPMLAIFRSSPYVSVKVSEGLRNAVGLTLSSNPLQLLFVEDGVYVLAQGCDPTLLEMPDPRRPLEMLVDMGIAFHADAEALRARGIAAPRYPVKALSPEEVSGLLAKSAVIVCW